MNRALDFTIAMLGALIAAMLVTGGGILRLAHAQIEFSSVDPWMIALLALLAWRERRGPGPFLAGVARAVRWLADPARGNRRSLALFLGVVLAATLAHFFKHWNFDTHAYDTLGVHQALFQAWPSAEHPALRCDICARGTFLAAHLSFPFLVLGIPFSFAPFQSDEWVFALQSAIVVAGIMGALRTLRLDRRPGLLLWALLPLAASRAFRSGLVWDFREDVIAFSALLGACAALHERRWATYGLCVALAALCKENIAFVTAFLAIPAWLHARSKRAAVLTALGSFAYAAFAFGWLIPHFTPGARTQSDIVLRMGDFGSTPAEIVTHLLTSPSAWWQLARTRLLSPDRLKYAVLLIAPFAPFLRRRSLPWLAPLAVGMAMNFAGLPATQRALQFHYDWITLPFLAMGAWAALKEQAPAGRRATWAFLLALALSGRWPGRDLSRHWPAAGVFEERAYLKALELDPRADARLLASGPAAAQLANLANRRIQVAEPLRAESLRPGDDALVDRREPADTAAESVLRGPGYRLIGQSPGGRFALYERSP